MWLFSDAPQDPEDQTVTETPGEGSFHSAMKSIMHVVWTEDEEAQDDAVCWIIQNANC